MISFKALIFCLLISWSGKTTSINHVITAKVIAIKDGDTIEILHEGKPLRIRLAHIDCPELKNNQPFGRAAKTFTSGICFSQQVTILHEGVFDRYKRLIAVVINKDKLNVNQELVKAGLAWHFTKYSTDNTYTQLEIIARKNRIGLWNDDNPVAPWLWRKKK